MTQTNLMVLEKEIKGGVILQRISNSLGRHATDPSVMKFIHSAVMYINGKVGTKQDISNCTQQSIIDSIINAATVGLPVDNKHYACLIPYGNTCNFQVEWRGYVAKIKEADPSLSVTVGLVFKGDKFEASKEDNTASYTHKQADPFEDRPENVMGAYCFIKGNLGSSLEVMSKKELDYIRSSSKMSGGSIWNSWTLEMYKKSIVRRACKIRFTEAVAELDAMDNRNFNEPKVESPRIAESAPLPPESGAGAGAGEIVDAEIVEPTKEDLLAQAEEAKKRINEEKAPERPTQEESYQDTGLAPETQKTVLRGLVASYEAPRGRGPSKFYVDGTWAQTFSKSQAETILKHKTAEEEVELNCREEKSKDGKFTNLIIDEISVIQGDK